MRVKISCNVNTRDAILNFCCLLYLIGRLICSEWINTCVPTLSMKRHLFRSFAYNEFMTLLGNFVRTSCCQEQSQACKRRQRTLGSRRKSKSCPLQHLTDANQVDGRRDGFGLQLRLWLTTIARPAQPMTANPFGNRAFDACPQAIARLERLKWLVLRGGAPAPHGWAEEKGLRSCPCASPSWYSVL